MKKAVLPLLLVCICAVSCHVSYNAAATYNDSPVKFLKLEGDGSVTVRASAIGRNYGDAFQQAAKKAEKEIIFKGINIPDNAHLSKPLLTEVNAEEKYEDFFNIFFMDKGDYLKFASMEDKRTGSTVETKSDASVKMTVTVRVLRSELKQYLTDHKVIK